MRRLVSQLTRNAWGRILIGLVALFALVFVIRPVVVVTTANLFGHEEGSSQLYIDQDGQTPVPNQ